MLLHVSWPRRRKKMVIRFAIGGIVRQLNGWM